MVLPQLDAEEGHVLSGGEGEEASAHSEASQLVPSEQEQKVNVSFEI